MLSARTSRYVYIKKQPPQPATVVLKNNMAPIVSGIFMFIGAAILAWVAWPIVSFKLLVAPRFAQFLAPIPEPRVRKVLTQATSDLTQVASKAVREARAQVVEDTSVDYTKASNWFPQLPQEETETAGITYKITIPKLGIEDASVIVGGEDLSKSMIHYGGTALPGEYGNAVVFCHSTLPYFFDPEDYTTICSTLPTLEKGDEIFVDYDGLRFKYIVEEMIVVKPRDIQILEQRFDDSYLSLVTCVPPGTYLERLVVKARLQKL